MLRFPEKAGRYLDQYHRAPAVLELPYSTDAAEELLAALCNRAALEEATDFQRCLVDPDMEFARALAKCSDEWRGRVAAWAPNCGFAASPWWLSVQSISRQLSGQATTVADLFASVGDLWVIVKHEASGGAQDVVADTRRLIEGITSGFKAAVEGLLGVRPHGRGGRYGPDVESRTAIVPVVVVPTSLTIGFMLPRTDPGMLSSPPDPSGQQAAACLIDVVDTLARGGEDADIEGLVPNEHFRQRMIESVRDMRGALAAETYLQLRASPAITRATAVMRSSVTRRPGRRRPARAVTLRGHIVAIDLDAGHMRIRLPRGEGYALVTYDDPNLFLHRQQAREWLDDEVLLPIYTRDQGDPPRRGVLREPPSRVADSE